MKLDIKNLLIMIYYELNYKEELISLIDTYKHFFHRDNAITKHVKDLSSLFINFVSELVKIYLNKNKKSVYLLKMKIEDTPYFNLKEWLLKKTGVLCGIK